MYSHTGKLAVASSEPFPSSGVLCYAWRMTKIFFLASTFVVLLTFCAVAEQVALQKPSQADSARFDKVYNQMSARFKAELPLDRASESERAAFLSDIALLLTEEKTFRSDDVSLFFLIDKKHNIGSSYVPKDLVPLAKNTLFAINRADLSLRPEAYEALEELARASQKDGITLLVSSTYRSYEYQKNLFQRWVRIDGLEEAERESAREGTSQHQLGTAVDFGSITDDFDETPMGQWVYKHASEYGWSLSFPKQYEDVTGYRWECWHFRYLGKEMCAFQKKWFGDIQQFMLEFVAAWKKLDE